MAEFNNFRNSKSGLTCLSGVLVCWGVWLCRWSSLLTSSLHKYCSTLPEREIVLSTCVKVKNILKSQGSILIFKIYLTDVRLRAFSRQGVGSIPKIPDIQSTFKTCRAACIFILSDANSFLIKGFASQTKPAR